MISIWMNTYSDPKFVCPVCNDKYTNTYTVKGSWIKYVIVCLKGNCGRLTWVLKEKPSD